MKKFLSFIGIFILMLSFTGCGSEKNSEQKQTQTKTAQETFYGAGQYKIGSDINSGEYLAFGTGYIEVAKDSSGGNNIIYNDNIKSFRYVSVNDGEYLKITGDIKLYPVANSPKIEANKENLTEGQYKVGKDIPAGEYNITTEGQGYFELNPDARKSSIIKNQFMPNATNLYVTVSEGQYLRLQNSTAKFVGETQKVANNPPSQQSIPQKVATLHINPTDFQQNYNQIMATEMGEMGASGMFNMPTPQIQKGNGQDVVQYTFEDGVIFMELIDPNTNEIKEIMITAMLPSGNTDAMRANLMAGLMLYVASLRATNLNLTSNDVQAIQNELGLNQSVDKWLNATSTSRGNIKYSKQIIPKVGMAFTISAQ